jgi:gamma-glutamyltranspeptidase/glutathione hydrolase
MYALAAMHVSLARAQATIDRAPEGASGLTHKPLVRAHRHMAVTAHPLASTAAHEMLQNGGSAADAAIAAQLVLNHVEPQSSGLGGGGFVLYWDARLHRLYAYDGRETAPAGARSDDFRDQSGNPLPFLEAVRSGKAVGVPGTVALLRHLHSRHGRLPWAKLFEPAIALATKGFPVSPRLHRLIAGTPSLRERSDTRAYFFTAEGLPRAAGSPLVNAAFAESLKLIAEHGPYVFYRGMIAAAIVETARGLPGPGTVSLDDLRQYEIVERSPVCSRYRIYKICGVGPPSSGGLAVLQILGMLEAFPSELVGAPDAEAAHVFLEATRLAFADRNLYVADPAFVRVPSKGLLDPAYLHARSLLIRRDRASEQVSPGMPPGERGLRYAPDGSEERSGTSHLSIVDRERNAIAFTTTIENAFGAQRFAAGFLLNNQLTDFSARAEQDGRPVANRIEPGKRPRSSMAPTIVFDTADVPTLIIGSPGGSRIIPYVASAIIAALDGKLDAQSAVNRPHVVTTGSSAELEAGTAAELLRAALAAKGHPVLTRDLVSGLHAISISNGLLWGGADPRREGLAVGE